MEPQITINGVVLTAGQVMTMRVALENFAIDMQHGILGDTETGKAMTAGYLARISEIRAAMGSAT